MTARVLLSVAVLLGTSMGFAAESGKSQKTYVYKLTSYWTGNNLLSSSPGPHCACDQDINAMDCSGAYDESPIDLGPVCYDEFIPFDSQGWVNAQVYVRE